MRTKTHFTFLAIVVAATQLGATDNGGCGPSEVLRDEGFDLWCGDELCTWKTVTGTIEKAPTWHSKDAGVAFVGDEAIIEQTSPVTWLDGSCIQFDLVANVDARAEMTLSVDVAGDGEVEHTERIPTASWKPVTFLLKLDGVYGGIRFELAKRGGGAATLAQIYATIVPPSDCEGFTAIAPKNLPNGAWCDDSLDCASSMCRDVASGFRACVGCESATTCDASETCGLGDPFSPVVEIPLECVPAGGDPVGDHCRFGDECASGICTNGHCSSCNGATPCPNEGACRAAWGNGPMTCNGGAPGAACASDVDCTSGRCNGPDRRECADGRPCDSPADCPPEDQFSLEPGACTLVGVQGGTCQ